MKKSQRLSLISGLDIAGAKKLYQADAEEPDYESAEAYLNDKSIVSLAKDVSGQNREDLMNSLLLAQMAANKQYSFIEEPEDWFDHFTNTMSIIGWVAEGNELSSYEAKKDVLEVEAVVLDILQSAIGEGIAKAAKTLITAVKSMANKEDKKFIAFEANTHTTSKGNFMLGFASEEKGALSFNAAMIILTAKEKIKQILFFRSEKNSTSLKYGYFKGTLNADFYDDARMMVKEKLGDARKKMVAGIEI